MARIRRLKSRSAIQERRLQTTISDISDKTRLLERQVSLSSDYAETERGTALTVRSPTLDCPVHEKQPAPQAVSQEPNRHMSLSQTILFENEPQPGLQEASGESPSAQKISIEKEAQQSRESSLSQKIFVTKESMDFRRIVPIDSIDSADQKYQTVGNRAFLSSPPLLASDLDPTYDSYIMDTLDLQLIEVMRPLGVEYGEEEASL